MNHVYLSYKLKQDIPAYGGFTSVDILHLKALKKGNSANVYSFTLQNHWGTHIDCPQHFFDGARGVGDYEPGEWLFTSPFTVDIDLKPSEILTPGQWLEKIDKNSDIVFIRSGWSKLRSDLVYCTENPGIHPDVGLYIREKLPRIRAIGIDWISVSSYQNRPLGRLSHKAFLNPNAQGQPILIIEDMDLTPDMEKIKEVWAVPLVIEGIDSAPCTVIGIF